MSLRGDASAWLKSVIDRAGGKAAGITHDWLASEAGVSRETISNVLNEKNDPEEATLVKIAAALNVPPPRVERVLRHDQAVVEPESPRAILRAATRLLARLDRRLATSADADGDDARREFDKQVQIHHHQVQGEKARTARQPQRAPRKKGQG